jgi:4-hydroxybenzoyl-CoA thioesterase
MSDSPYRSPEGAELSTLYQSRRTIRFGYCDPAGIVFYPQYFLLLNELVEDWFANWVGVGFPELHLRRRIGTPTVRVICEFGAPSRLGDELLWDLSVQRVGNSSIDLAVRVSVAEQTRLTAKLTLVTVSLDTFRAVPIPDDIRTRLVDCWTT